MFPNKATIVWLVGAILRKQKNEWVAQCACYMSLETIAPIGDNPVVALSAVTA
ncbi:MAG: hypothetical protein ACKODC_02840 [Limnohabitans sp.]|jgi:putative transposase